MRRHLSLVAVLLFLSTGTVFSQESVTYEGPWRTTNRKLDGVMKCAVTSVGHEKWQGRFYGIWQGVPFDYIVKFSGPISNLRGTANIDGADYSWTGQMSQESPRTFKGAFGGNRYAGYFEMKERARGDFNRVTVTK